MSKEPELEHHVIADLAARLAKAERERDQVKAIVAKCCNALPNGAYCSPDASIDFMGHVPDEVLLVTSQIEGRVAAAEAKLAKAERALEEAEAVIKPLAAYAAKYNTPEYGQFDWAAIAIGHLRAARKWMESRHD